MHVEHERRNTVYLLLPLRVKSGPSSPLPTSSHARLHPSPSHRHASTTMTTVLSPTAAVLTSPTQRTTNARTHLPPNVANVVLGALHIKPWYPSFYPEETLGGKKKVEWLYVCQWCFRYTAEVLGICGHCVGYSPSQRWIRWWRGAVMKRTSSLTIKESVSLERRTAAGQDHL